MQDNLTAVIEFIKKHKERVALFGLGVAFLIFIVGGIYLQKAKKREIEPLPVPSPKRVELTPDQKEKAQRTTEVSATNSSYFLKPSPEELLEQLASMEHLNEDVIDAKFSNLPVLWPAYFFAVRKAENGRTSVLLDVSEDGFGVVIESEVDLNLYPQLRELVSGTKIWIGGEILTVDRAGTGTIYFKAEQFWFSAEAPFSQTLQETKRETGSTLLR